MSRILALKARAKMMATEKNSNSQKIKTSTYNNYNTYLAQKCSNASNVVSTNKTINPGAIGGSSSGYLKQKIKRCDKYVNDGYTKSGKVSITQKVQTRGDIHLPACKIGYRVVGQKQGWKTVEKEVCQVVKPGLKTISSGEYIENIKSCQ